MGLRDWWNEQETGVKLLVVAGVVFVGLAVIAFVVFVILSAVIGSFVLGMGSQADVAPPSATFDVEYDDATEELTITHAGGDSLDADRVTVEVDDRTVDWEESDGDIVSGDELTVDDVAVGAEIRVVWTFDDEQQVLYQETAEADAPGIDAGAGAADAPSITVDATAGAGPGVAA
jgi:FlaG/FlaF family flagellin (archaellin)